MRLPVLCLLVCLGISRAIPAEAQDALKMATEAAKKSTLDQPGTHPFHLRATLAPSQARDSASGRTGQVEIWWQSPGVYRRELRSPSFHQIEIVNDAKIWQSNEGNYMPDWLDSVADAFLHPLPKQSAASRGISPDKGRNMLGSIYLNWEKPIPMDMQPSKQVVAITGSTGLLFYDGGLGWGALFADYSSFHGRSVPRTVSNGSPEVTAKVTLMEDLAPVAEGWFDASASGGDPHPVRFVAIDKTNLSTDLATAPPPLIWPDIPNTRVDGTIWTDLVLDRMGHIAEPFTTISDNPALTDFMHEYLIGPLETRDLPRRARTGRPPRGTALHFGKACRLLRQ